jgi:hypothetical protein
VDVSLGPGENIVGCELQLPDQGPQDSGYNLVVSGWADGRAGPVTRLRIAQLAGASGSPPGRMLLEVALAEPRPDAPEAERQAPEGTFHASLSLVGTPAECELDVSCGFADDSWEPLARLRIKRTPLPAADPSSIRPVLLRGPGRAGSTWLIGLLGRHPEAVAYAPFRYEPRIGGFWSEVFRALSRPAGYSRAIHPEDVDSPEWWVARRDWLPLVDTRDEPALERWLTKDSVEQLADFCRGRIDGFYEEAAKTVGAAHPSCFVERDVNPGLTAILRELYPSLRYVFLIRDPRDVLASRLAFIAKRGYLQFGRHAAGSDDEYVRNQFTEELRGFLQTWSAYRDIGILVRYEELMRTPEGTLAAICEHLGIDAAGPTLETVVSGAPLVSPERQAGHRTAGDEESIGRWRSDLSPELQAGCREALGPLVAELGYDRD